MLLLYRNHVHNEVREWGSGNKVVFPPSLEVANYGLADPEVF
jgi:hypothetical protein